MLLRVHLEKIAAMREQALECDRLTFARGLEITSRKNDAMASMSSVRIPM
jgi:hypothetical protein